MTEVNAIGRAVFDEPAFGSRFIGSGCGFRGQSMCRGVRTSGGTFVEAATRLQHSPDLVDLGEGVAGCASPAPEHDGVGARVEGEHEPRFQGVEPDQAGGRWNGREGRFSGPGVVAGDRPSGASEDFDLRLSQDTRDAESTQRRTERAHDHRLREISGHESDDHDAISAPDVAADRDVLQDCRPCLDHDEGQVAVPSDRHRARDRSVHDRQPARVAVARHRRHAEVAG